MRTLSFTLEQPGPAELSAFDPAGRRVARIHAGQFPAGPQEVRWDDAALARGVYFVVLEAAGSRATQKLVVR
jgi:hypothetical protein